jgi:hypothetical protein
MTRTIRQRISDWLLRLADALHKMASHISSGVAVTRVVTSTPYLTLEAVATPHYSNGVSCGITRTTYHSLTSNLPLRTTSLGLNMVYTNEQGIERVSCKETLLVFDQRESSPPYGSLTTKPPGIASTGKRGSSIITYTTTQDYGISSQHINLEKAVMDENEPYSCSYTYSSHGTQLWKN